MYFYNISNFLVGKNLKIIEFKISWYLLNLHKSVRKMSGIMQKLSTWKYLILNTIEKIRNFLRLILNVNMIMWDFSEERRNGNYYKQRDQVWLMLDLYQVLKIPIVTFFSIIFQQTHLVSKVAWWWTSCPRYKLAPNKLTCYR